MVNVDFSIQQAWSEANELFTNTGMRYMLEGRDYLQVDMGPFVAAFVYLATDRSSHDCSTYNVLMVVQKLTKYSDKEDKVRQAVECV